jgi:S-(hydroxymethyl)glutathione dehydrogenase/alcohol dehydrogenase
MKARAVVCRENNQPVQVSVETIDCRATESGEVMIRLAACGVCHSDLSATNGTIPFPPPLILGHEGAGASSSRSAPVADFAVGDPVLSSFVTMCGTCHYCTIGRPRCATSARRRCTRCRRASCEPRTPRARRSTSSPAVGVMAEYATLSAMSLIRLPADVPARRPRRW